MLVECITARYLTGVGNSGRRSEVLTLLGPPGAAPRWFSVEMLICPGAPATAPRCRFLLSLFALAATEKLPTGGSLPSARMFEFWGVWLPSAASSAALAAAAALA